MIPSTVRASGLPLAMACPASLFVEGLAIEQPDPSATLGTAAHEAFAALVLGVGVDVDDLSRKHRVDVNDLDLLLNMAKKLWVQVQDYYPDPKVEHRSTQPLSGGSELLFELSGTVDVLSVCGSEIRIWDWKTGYRDQADYYDQLKGYSLLAMLHYGGKEATARIGWVRSCEVETHVFKKAELLEYRRELEKRLEWDQKTYSPGPHCQFCPRYIECPGRRQLVKSSVADLMTATVETMTPEMIVDVYQRVALVERACKNYRDAVRVAVERDGPVGGKNFKLVIKEIKRAEIDPLQAWSVLQAQLDDEELAKCVKIKKTTLEQTVAKKAGCGAGAAAKRELMDQLKAADAIHYARSRQLKEVRLLPHEREN